jgi:hypothetical protein
MFTITLTASPELLSVLQQIAGALGNAKTEAPKPKKNGTVPGAAEVAATVTEPKNEPAQELTLEQVRAIVVPISKKEGNKEKVQAILKEFGAEKTPELKKEHYAAFLEKVKAL